MISKFRIDEQGRECCKCKVYKVWDEFKVSKNGPKGYSCRCKACVHEWQASEECKKANRERAHLNYTTDPDFRAKQIEATRRYLEKKKLAENQVKAENEQQNQQALNHLRKQRLRDGIKCRIDEQGRECSVCLQYKVWDEFNEARNKTGHFHRCKACLRPYRASEAYKQAAREQAAKNYQDPIKRAKQIEAQKRYYSKPEIQRKLRSKGYRAVVAKRAKNYRKEIATDPERLAHFREVNRRNQQKHIQDPTNKLSSQMSWDIRNRLRQRSISKNRRHWEDLVDFTVEALKQHLESLFEPGMNWDNHTLNGWHIDHKIPVCSFNFKSVEDPEFKKCWALENLAPRWATTDIAKSYGSNSLGNINKGKKLIFQ